MLRGHELKVYTDHSNLIKYALGSTSDRVYRWRQLIEEYGPEIIYIKVIHNTVADALSRLEYDPSAIPKADYSHFNEMNSEDVNHHQWKAVAKMFGLYCSRSKSHNYTNMMSTEYVFANHSKEDEIFPLTVREIADAQKADVKLKSLLLKDAVLLKGITLQNVEDISCLCDNNRMIIPKLLQKRATQWYHHYLQHPGHTRLEEVINATMYWKGMRTTIRTLVRTC